MQSALAGAGLDALLKADFKAPLSQAVSNIDLIRALISSVAPCFSNSASPAFTGSLVGASSGGLGAAVIGICGGGGGGAETGRRGTSDVDNGLSGKEGAGTCGAAFCGAFDCIAV
jgi:hypothetical protein